MPTIPRTESSLTPGQIIANHQRSAPVNVVAIAQELGIRVWEMPSLPSNISGKIFKDPVNGGSSGFSIAVNARESHERKRFTVAHEIGHFVLHRRQLDEHELVDDTMYRSGLSTREEADANKFAAEILMPHRLIQSLVSSGIKDAEGLARALQVSVPAIKIRLGIPVG